MFESSFVSSRNVLTGCETEASDCPWKAGIGPLYRNRLCASQHCKLTLLFQVQEIVLHKMHCTHSNIWGVLEQYWKIQLNHWFLVVSSFGSPNKVLSLSQRNTASLGHGAGGSNNTTARIKIKPSFFACTFGWCYAHLPTLWRRHVFVFKWAVLGGRVRVLTFIKNISSVLRL